ncbi:MAG: hypothetical protein ACKO68_09310 [Bacteroidota bacterium]
MKHRVFEILGILLLVLFTACAPSRYVKPLAVGQHAVQANFGGPVAKIPGIGTIPMPLTSVGYGYGYKGNLTLFGNLHTTSLLFGVGQLELGAVWRCWKGERAGVTLQPTLNSVVDLYTGANRFWPQLDGNFYWDYREIRTKGKNDKGFHKTRSLYGGISQWFDPYRIESQGRKNEQFWIPSVQVGHLWERNSWVFQGELKVLAPIYSNQDIVVNYPSLLGNRGALGLYFSATYHFKSHE